MQSNLLLGVANMELFTQKRIKFSQKYNTQKDLQSF